MNYCWKKRKEVKNGYLLQEKKWNKCKNMSKVKDKKLTNNLNGYRLVFA